MNPFVYEIPTKVYFGEDQLSHLGPELARFGKKVLLVYGGGSIKRTSLYDRIVKEVEAAGLELFELPGVEPNPRVATVRKGAQICKDEGIDVVLAVGGGSTIDCSKFVAASACVDHDPWDFFVKGAPVEKALPLVTILTIAATGSEMDDGGVISNPDTHEKLFTGNMALLPKVSFEDPTLTYTVPKYQTASGSADILSHVLEVYFDMAPGLYMLDAFMEGLMKTVIRFAPVALAHPDDYEARANLMWASSWAINGFVNGGRGVDWSCHAMEHELSAFYDITHGHGLAILTPRWMEYCLSEKTVSKYVQYGVNVFGLDATADPMVVARQAIERTADFLYDKLGLASTLTDLGIDDTNFELMAEKACKAYSGDCVDGFVRLEPQDIVSIYRMCL